MITRRALALWLFFLPAVLSAQAPDNRIFYYPKPVAQTPWQPPMKPITRLADWVVMLGELRWTFEGDDARSIVTTQGDIVYAPPKTWHAPQFWANKD